MNRRRAIMMGALASISGAILHAETTVDAERDQIERTELAVKNAAAIRQYHRVLSSGDISAAVLFFAEDTRNHGTPVGRQGLVRVLTDIHTTFPDWKMEIEDLDAVGDDVIVRVTVTGTHKGVSKIPVDGGLLVGVPPTGKSFKVQHIHWWTLKDGLIVEHRANRDDVGMMQQLGLLPAVKRHDLPQK